jgi:hypothetical protein
MVFHSSILMKSVSEHGLASPRTICIVPKGMFGNSHQCPRDYQLANWCLTFGVFRACALARIRQRVCPLQPIFWKELKKLLRAMQLRKLVVVPDKEDGPGWLLV